MAPIQSLLSEILTDDELMQLIGENAMKIKNYDDQAQSIKEVVQAIDYVAESYQAVGGLVSEIDRKHSTYTKSSIEKIQYLITADQTIRGKLAEILGTYAKMPEEKREQLVDLMEEHTNVGRQQFFDANSLYHKNVRSRRIDREPLSVQQKEDLTGLLEDYLQQQLSSGYSLAQIRAFIERLFSKGNSEITAEKIPITDDVDFILLILAVIRQNEKTLSYRVQMRNGQVERNGYVIPNMIISRKGDDSHVE
jgi:DNA polymerase/3'-5' exonuclease PolX